MNPIDRQTTIETPFSVEGVGLHTGKPSRMTVHPGNPGNGIIFRRVDLPGQPEIPAGAGNVAEVLRGTTLASGEARVHTVEHIMAAAYGMGLDNLSIDLEGPEPPAMDGSSRSFAEMLRKAEKVFQDKPREPFSLKETAFIEEGDRSLTYLASDRFEITYTLEYPNNLVPRQTLHIEVTEETFFNLISPARTFGFVHEFDMLKEKNLALGGSLENAVVINTDGSILNPEGKRNESEFILHKILDLIGDLALIGKRLKGHFIAHKTGHGFNCLLAKRLCRMLHETQERKPLGMMTFEEIKTFLPHRYPMLLVDKIISLVPGKSAIGIKNVTGNEEFFQGHFPQRAVMPGVLLVEAMAQVAGVLFLSQPEHKGKLPFFAGIDRVRFRRPVVPGDRLELRVNVLKVRGNTGKVAVEALVEGERVTSAELMFTIV